MFLEWPVTEDLIVMNQNLYETIAFDLKSVLPGISPGSQFRGGVEGEHKLKQQAETNSIC